MYFEVFEVYKGIETNNDIDVILDATKQVKKTGRKNSNRKRSKNSAKRLKAFKIF